ncbi:MAG: T9SS type A sorting domain-containing protein [Bacteroidota bacterium]
MGLNFATTDGIGGAPGSVIKRCDIDTYDDAIKIYGENMVVEDVKIFWNRNGAPLQMGWGASNFYQKGNATITGLTVIKRGNNHNQGIISWAKGEFSSNKKGTRTLTFNGNNNIPNDNKVIQFGASGKTNNVILNLKGSYVCNNKSKFQKVFFKNTGGNCLARSQGCSGNFNKTGRFAQPEANLSLSVYPNPASNAIIIAGIPEEQRVYIYNLQGKAVLPDQKGPKVNIATLPPGMYLVRTADGLQQAKFLKQ